MEKNCDNNYWIVTDEDVKSMRHLYLNQEYYTDPDVPQKYRIMMENTSKSMALVAWNILSYYRLNMDAIKAICNSYSYGHIMYSAIGEFPIQSLDTDVSYRLMEVCIIRELLQLNHGELKETIQEQMWNMCEHISF